MNVNLQLKSKNVAYFYVVIISVVLLQQLKEFTHLRIDKQLFFRNEI